MTNLTYKIWNPYHKLFFDGMNKNGQGGHGWSIAGRAFGTHRGLLSSFRCAMCFKIPSDFIIVEFDENKKETFRVKIGDVTKTKVIDPKDNDYGFQVTEHIDAMAFKKPFMVDGIMIVAND